jgi:hypothetical protein
VVYSDASYDQGSGRPPRLGWVIFQPGVTPIGRTMLLDWDLVSYWLPRQQQIMAAEAFAALALPSEHFPVLRGRDVVWFIDNQSACSSLIRGGSAAEDVEQIALVTHLLFLVLGSRVWFEWIDTDSNPADGLSRLGLEDPWTQGQGWELGSCAPPDWARTNFPANSLLHDLLLHWAGTGCLGRV